MWHPRLPASSFRGGLPQALGGMDTTNQARVQVTRSWIAAFGVSAAASPLGLFALGAAFVSATLSAREWLVVCVFFASSASCVLLYTLRDRFCSLTRTAQHFSASALAVLVFIGYALVLFNVQRAA